MGKKVEFRRLGTMIDCSRNAVMNLSSVKKWIDICADLGYNTLLLYTEDTYEVDDNPYFGYLRGRYSQAELKEIDAYAIEKGMELIPCIQTLAHLNAIKRWAPYAPLIDTDDILLADDEMVYELIDKMFFSISKCFTSKIVNIGMDEAHMIGRGKYYDIHGDTNRTEILINHIRRVAQIAEKYDFTLIMWSDMFYRLANGGKYYADKLEFNCDIKNCIPNNVQLVYWDYYSEDKRHYDNMLKSHLKLNDNIWFAGGIWTWIGFAPHNDYSIKATSAALESCRKNGISDIFLTLWGDDGGECSKFTTLPSLFYASEIAKGNRNIKDIKEKFKQKYDISFDRFMLLDLRDGPNNQQAPRNPEKYLFYNDPFLGILDSTLSGGEGEGFAKCARHLSLVKKNEEWGYLFDTLHALCDALAIKANLGQKTRAVYSKRDNEALCELIADYKKLIKKLNVFYAVYRKQWYKENKPHGFDVQDIRIGGLIKRIENCTERLIEFRDGKIDKIEELEENLLDAFGGGNVFAQEAACFQTWINTVTPNVI